MRTASPATTATPTTRPGSGAADLVRVGRVGLGGLADGRGERAVDDLDLAGLAVQLEEDGPLAVGVRLADGQELDDQRLARLDLDEVLGARLGAEEEDRRRQDRRVGVRPLVGGEVGEDAGIEQVARARRGRSPAGRASAAAFSRAAARSAGGRSLPGRSVDRRAGPCRTRSWSTGGNPPGGWPSRPSNSSTTLSGKASSRSGSSVSSGVRLLATRNRAMSPTTFDVGVTLTMSPKRRLTSAYALQTSGQRDARPERLGLLEEVRVLAAGHLVGVDLGRGGLQAASRTGRRARGPPPSSGSARSGPSGSTPGLAGGEPERLDDRVQARLRGQARHRRDRAVGDVEPDLGPLQHARGLGAADVVGVEVDRDADLLAERLDQLLGRVTACRGRPCP